jgi:hypothetical protein
LKAIGKQFIVQSRRPLKKAGFCGRIRLLTKLFPDVYLKYIVEKGVPMLNE